MYVASSWMTTCEGFHLKRQNRNSSWSWKKTETPQRSEYRNTHSTKHKNEKSNAQGNNGKYVGQRDFRKIRCIRKGKILLLWTLMIHMATCEAWVSLFGHTEREFTSSIGEVSIRWIQHTGMQKRTPHQDKKKNRQKIF